LTIKAVRAFSVAGTTQVIFDFEFRCDVCGSGSISVPDDGAVEGDVTCAGCGRRFGTLAAVRGPATEIGLRDLHEGRVKLTVPDESST